MKKVAVIILAAGKGKRMKSPLPKVLHLLADKPLLAHAIGLAKGLNPDRIIVVIGHGAEKVRQWSVVSGQCPKREVEFIEQKEQLGTGHAVQQTEGALRDYNGNILILSGDVPLLRTETIDKLIKTHISSGAAATILTAKVNNPTGYGRVLRDKDGMAINIIEEKDASSEMRNINEINSGIYCFKKDFLFDGLKKIDKNNIQREYYLTDVVGIAFKSSLKIETLIADDPNEIMGINTQEELKEAEVRLRRKGEDGEVEKRENK